MVSGTLNHGGEPLLFIYKFAFREGREKVIRIALEPDTLQHIPLKAPVPDSWTRLTSSRCPVCPLDPGETPHCPVALGIRDLVLDFRDRTSHEEVDVKVETSERIYFERTSIQRGLSSILGILMVTSGCPVLDKLRPMVRFHLPFPSLQETAFRATSAYLLGQFFLKKRGLEADFTLNGLVEIYNRIKVVNKAMADRIRALRGKDANINALILLDAFAMDIPFTIEERIAELEPLFHTYFD